MLPDGFECRTVGLRGVLCRYPSVSQPPRKLEHPLSEGTHIHGWMGLPDGGDLHERFLERIVFPFEGRGSTRGGSPKELHDSDGLLESPDKVVHTHTKGGEIHRFART